MERILVVEDSLAIATILQRKISAGTSFPVDVAGTLAAAVELVEQHRSEYFLAVLDLSLPDAPNGEVVDTVLAYGIPVIVLTASFDDDTRDQMLSKKICDYILKRGEEDFQYLLYRIRRLDRNRKTKVLVADDSAVFRGSLASILRTQLFEFHLAKDGIEALALIEAHPDIRLVIADYNMPNMDGYAFVNAIRKTAKKSELAIVVVSGSDGSNVIPKFLKVGANDFLRKPFNKEELVCRINANLDMLDLIAENKNLVQRDYLTGNYSRLYLYEVGSILLGNARRNHGHLALAMLDIDRFKAINDTWGHAVGDHYLKALGQALANGFNRRSDVVARLGGDEFCVVMSYEDEAALCAFVERIRTGFGGSVPSYGGCTQAITLSVGLCCSLHDSLDEMMKVADDALYQAKREGRDRMVVKSS